MKKNSFQDQFPESSGIVGLFSAYVVASGQSEQSWKLILLKLLKAEALRLSMRPSCPYQTTRKVRALCKRQGFVEWGFKYK